MKKLVDSQQMRAIDTYAIETIGIPSLVLMENAANQVVKTMESKIDSEDIILVISGSGNNGGDGLAIARILLNRGYQVDVFFAGKLNHLSNETQKQLTILENLDMVIWTSLDEVEFDHYTVLVDALYGIGLTGTVTDASYAIIERMNQHHGLTYAVDMPSGISADDGKVKGIAVKADYTITFGEEKLGQILYPGGQYCGQLILADIGFPPHAAPVIHSDFYRYDRTDLKRLPKRDAYTHKGSFGRVLVVAGSENMSGAAFFSAKAAYRTGAGLVEILTVDANRTILQAQLPEAILTTYNPEDLDSKEEKNAIKKAVERASSIVVGPGLGTSHNSQKLLDLMSLYADVPVVMDADAINIASNYYNTFPLMRNNTYTRINELSNSLPAGSIVTPHMKEFARLTDQPMSVVQEDLLEITDICTKDSHLVFAIKDARSMVAHDSQRYLNYSGNNGMATAGSGDVLTGIIAGLIAQGLPSFEAAKLGSYVHGLAGDYVSQKLSSYSVMASDLIDSLSDVFL